MPEQMADYGGGDWKRFFYLVVKSAHKDQMLDPADIQKFFRTGVNTNDDYHFSLVDIASDQRLKHDMLIDIRQIAGHFGAIFRPGETRCKEIPWVADCAGSQIAGVAASKRWNDRWPTSGHSSTLVICLICSRWLLMPVPAARAAGRSATGCRRTSVAAPRLRPSGR
jgi:hypothetical protein